MKDQEYFVFSKALRNKNTTVRLKPLMFNEVPFSGMHSSKLYANVRGMYSRGHLFGCVFVVQSNDTKVLNCRYFDFLVGDHISLTSKYIYHYDYSDCGVEIEYDYGSNKFNMELSSDDLDLERILNENADKLKVINEIEVDSGWMDPDELLWSMYSRSEIEQRKAMKTYWAKKRLEKFKNGEMSDDVDLLPFYLEQKKIKTQIIRESKLPFEVKYIAGVDVSYNDEEQLMVGSIAVFSALTMELVEERQAIIDVTFPYIPEFFSYREVPPVVSAYKKLNIRPDLIVCNGHGVSHPRGVGMASHLGVVLGVPTIGCSMKRIVGSFDKEELRTNRGSFTSLVWNEEAIGIALRTQANAKPVFVSIGHKIDIDSAKDWILKLCKHSLLPDPTKRATKISDKIIKFRTEYDLFEDLN